MSKARMTIVFAIALSVAGATSAFAQTAGLEDADHTSRGHPTPTQWNAALHAHAQVLVAPGFSSAPAYTGGRAYIGTDPDPAVRSLLLRDAPADRS